MMKNFHGVTNLDENMLSTLVPQRTFGGGALIGDAAEVLFLWRSVATQKARDGTLAFFLDDSRLEPLWARPERYAVEFRRFGIASIVESDFSLWVDDPIDKQLLAVKQKKIVSRIFQEHGLLVVPNLNWSDESSFRFCFAGVPIHAPVCMTECRTAGGNDDDRRAFLKGLEHAVKEIRPQHVCIYGGAEHSFWLKERLPAGPTYTLLEAWTSVRGKIRKAERRQAREKDQLQLFTGGTSWVDVDHRAA